MGAVPPKRWHTAIILHNAKTHNTIIYIILIQTLQNKCLKFVTKFLYRYILPLTSHNYSISSYIWSLFTAVKISHPNRVDVLQPLNYVNRLKMAAALAKFHVGSYSF
jgi:hypothetical protein